MAPSCTTVLMVAFLILALTQGCRGEPYEQAAALVAVMVGVGQAEQCFGDSTQEDIRLLRQDNQALYALSDVVMELKEQMLQQNADINFMKKECAAIRRGDALTREIQDLKRKLQDKQQMEYVLNENIKDLKVQLKMKDTYVRQLTKANAKLRSQYAVYDKQMQGLDKKLLKSQRHVKQLEDTVKKLNNSVVEEKKSDCFSLQNVHQHHQKIKELVQKFVKDSNWAELRRGLETELDQGSEVYQQLQTIAYDDSWRMYRVGENGHEQLATLLLCAGLPPDTTDLEDGDTMMQGAAANGHLGVVKLLLRHGADVDTRGYLGRTPLVRASQKGNLEVVRALVQAGADTSAKNNDGLTALQLSESQDVSHYLLQFPH